MQEQADALATHMACPKTVRILTLSLPQSETRSLEVLTGRSRVQSDGMAWDDDGKTVEGWEPEYEFQNVDNISSFSDE